MSVVDLNIRLDEETIQQLAKQIALELEPAQPTQAPVSVPVENEETPTRLHPKRRGPLKMSRWGAVSKAWEKLPRTVSRPYLAEWLRLYFPQEILSDVLDQMLQRGRVRVLPSGRLRMVRVRELIQAEPELSVKLLATKLGVAEQTVRKYRRE